MQALMGAVMENVVASTIAAGVVAVLAACVGRWGRNPSLAHAFWIIVLLTLMMPAIWSLPILSLEGLGASESLTKRETHAMPSSWRGKPRKRDQGHPMGKNKSADRGVREPRMKETTGPRDGRFRIEEADGDSSSGPGSVNERLWQGISGKLRGVSRWEQVVVGVWVLGSLLWFGLVAWRLLKFGRCLRLEMAVSSELTGKAKEIGEYRGLARTPSVGIVDAQIPPLLWGRGACSVIVLPRRLLENLTDREARSLIAHELAHFVRRDYIWRWLQGMVLGVFWWHPLAWWASSGVRRAEEACCDGWVTGGFNEHNQDYANALLKSLNFLAEHSTAAPMVACRMGRETKFKKVRMRFNRILHERPCFRMSRVQYIAVVIAAMPVLTVNVLSSNEDLGNKASIDDSRPRELSRKARGPQRDHPSKNLNKSRRQADYRMVAMIGAEKERKEIRLPASAEDRLKLIKDPTQKSRTRIRAAWALAFDDRPKRHWMEALLGILGDKEQPLAVRQSILNVLGHWDEVTTDQTKRITEAVDKSPGLKRLLENIEVSNGEFESIVLKHHANDFQGLFGEPIFDLGSIALDGWQTHGGPTGLRKMASSANGGYALELGPRATPGCISQTIRTNTGKTYQLSFLTCTGRDSFHFNQRIRVMAGSVDTTVQCPVGDTFRGRQVMFKAQSPLTTVTFCAVGNEGFGPVIDSVSVRTSSEGE